MDGKEGVGSRHPFNGRKSTPTRDPGLGQPYVFRFGYRIHLRFFRIVSHKTWVVPRTDGWMTFLLFLPRKGRLRTPLPPTRTGSCTRHRATVPDLVDLD